MKKLAFVLFKYFPHGGLQRDMLKIALECRDRGCDITIYTMIWEGARPEGIKVVVLGRKGTTNIANVKSFVNNFEKVVDKENFNGIVGFNKMPGLDIYYAADICFYKDSLEKHGFLYRLARRFRRYHKFEKSVFGPSSQTEIMAISPQQVRDFTRFYSTEEARMTLLPPGVDKKFRRPSNWSELRRETRNYLGLGEEDILFLQIGSAYKTKGLARSIKAIASLPQSVRGKVKFCIIGSSNPLKYRILAKTLRVDHLLEFIAPTEDVERYLFAADLLLHPSLRESAGIVLLESLVAGLPVVCTANCGHAHYIEDAHAGTVVPEPFCQEVLNTAVSDLMHREKLRQLAENGLRYAEENDLYRLHREAADFIIQNSRGNIEK